MDDSCLFSLSRDSPFGFPDRVASFARTTRWTSKTSASATRCVWQICNTKLHRDAASEQIPSCEQHSNFSQTFIELYSNKLQITVSRSLSNLFKSGVSAQYSQSPGLALRKQGFEPRTRCRHGAPSSPTGRVPESDSRIGHSAGFRHAFRCFMVRWPVSRVLCTMRRRRIGDGHSSGTPVARRLVRSTRTRDRRLSCPRGLRLFPTLLPAGLAVPLPSPAARWALTPPFHPCPHRGRSVLCGAFPKVPAHANRPSPGVTRRRAFVEPGLSSRSRRAAIRPPDHASIIWSRTREGDPLSLTACG